LGNSLTYIATEENKVVGYIRAISDGVFLTFIAEMVIAKTHRKKQIGTKLIAYLMNNHPTPKFELISDTINLI